MDLFDIEHQDAILTKEGLDDFWGYDMNFFGMRRQKEARKINFLCLDSNLSKC